METTSEDVIGYIRKQTGMQRSYAPHSLKTKARRHERRKIREALHQYALDIGDLE